MKRRTEHVWVLFVGYPSEPKRGWIKDSVFMYGESAQAEAVECRQRGCLAVIRRVEVPMPPRRAKS